MRTARKNQSPQKKRCIVIPVILAAIAVLVVSVVLISIMSAGNYEKTVYRLGASYEAAEYTLTFENGDTIYTPDSSHIALDPDRTALYYDNLLLAFTTHDLTEQECSTLAQVVSGKVVGHISGAMHAVQILVDAADLDTLEAMADTLMNTDMVMYAYSDYPVQIMGSDSRESDAVHTDLNEEDLLNDQNWWIQAIDANTAWEYSGLCQPFKAGIIDSGFSATHEDLAGKIVPVGSASNDAIDDHGVHVSGIIGALNNDIGMRGITETAEIYCADLWHENHEDSFHTLAEYMAVFNNMVQSGVKVINNSWGCITLSEESYQNSYAGASRFTSGVSVSEGHRLWLDQRMNQDLIPTAEASIAMIGQLIASGYEDILIVQAAGNGYYDTLGAIDARQGGFFCAITASVFDSLPASLAEELAAHAITYRDIDERILIVGAASNYLDDDGNFYMAIFSNYGETVDICAPGIDIYSTVTPESGCYDVYSGTSMSAPMVTGSAAYIWSIDPSLSAPDVRAILLESASVQAIGIDNSSGWNYPMLNLGRAVESILTD